MRNAKFWIAGLALLLGTRARAQSFTVGGSVSGLTGTGLVLQNNGADDLAIGGNIAFTFATPVTAYSVTVLNQPNNPPQSCGVQNGVGVASANVSAVVVSCGPPSVLAPMPPPANFDFSPLFDAVNQSTNFTVSTRTSIDTIGQRLYKDESDIAKLQSNGGGVGPAGPQGPQGIPGPAGPAGANGAPGANGTTLPGYAVPSGYAVQITAVNAGCKYGTQGANTAVLVVNNGPIYCDYPVFIPQDGTYTITTHMAITSGSTPVVFHYEYPVGSTVASKTYTPTGTSYAFVTVSAALTHGFNILRFSYDTPEPGTNTNSINWISLAKQ